MPPVPHDIEDVVIEEEWPNTWARKQYLLHQDNDRGVLVYATESNLRCLQRRSDICIDGTFKTCHSPYVQFLTIHGMYHVRGGTPQLCSPLTAMLNQPTTHPKKTDLYT